MGGGQRTENLVDIINGCPMARGETKKHARIVGLAGWGGWGILGVSF